MPTVSNDLNNEKHRKQYEFLAQVQVSNLYLQRVEEEILSVLVLWNKIFINIVLSCHSRCSNQQYDK